MRVLQITDITRKETFIYYRREFSGKALYELPGRETVGQIEFVIETAPTGKKEVHVKLLDPVDYPLLPVMQNLKETITGMDNEGMLP